MMNLHPYLDFAIQTAWEAGQLTLGYFQTGLRPEFKADDTPVTLADREAEKLIRHRIEKKYPGHDIIGEEFGGAEVSEASHRWLIDPIDGTRSFVRGVPLYAILIGLEIEGECRVGVAHFPALNEMIAAASGLGCRWNGRLARVSEVADLGQALVTHYDAASYEKAGRGAAWARLKKATGYRAGWCDAYGYCLVATGRAEISMDPFLNVWDAGPLPAILSEAGGYFGDWQGNRTIYANEGLATTQALLPQVLAVLKGE